MRTAALAFLLSGCGSDVAISKDARCDGVKQGDEDTVDLPFDADGDGYFDASNPGCAGTYAADRLDCADGDPAVHPGAAEAACDEIDNDCDPETADAVDADGDGADECVDCDDADDAVLPGGTEVACNEVDDDCDEETPDAVDADGDGWNECQDCDDLVAAKSPSEVEATCNGIDDDCDETTPDDEDADGDGTSLCDGDCDDADPDRSPAFEEVCDDEIDNDCDGEADEECTTDYTGTWDLDQRVSYGCALGSVSIDFDSVFIEDTNPTISVTSTGSGFQPGTMEGTFTSDTTFETERIITGTCNEIYTFAGTFVDESTFAATFEARFTGSFCLDCTAQSFILTGTR